MDADDIIEIMEYIRGNYVPRDICKEELLEITMIDIRDSLRRISRTLSDIRENPAEDDSDDMISF